MFRGRQCRYELGLAAANTYLLGSNHQEKLKKAFNKSLWSQSRTNFFARPWVNEQLLLLHIKPFFQNLVSLSLTEPQKIWPG